MFRSSLSNGLGGSAFALKDTTVHFRGIIWPICVVAAAFISTITGVTPAHCEGIAGRSSAGPVLAMARKSAEHGLVFLGGDAAKWHVERKCASCHQGVMTVWAMCEAKSQGYEIYGEPLAETAKWTKVQLSGIDKPKDPRPALNAVSTPALYLAVMARAVPKQEALTANDLRQIIVHLEQRQEDDGSWTWSKAPAQNRPPPVLESDEVVTLLVSMALRSHVTADTREESIARDSRDKAATWLSRTSARDSTQAAAFRLLLKSWDGTTMKDLKPEIDRFLSRQNKDGGWGQTKDLPSDAYATGQALYVLSFAGVKNTQASVQRGAAFLIANQKDDGSWPMTSRAQPGATPFKNPAPITYFGSAWATLGLMRTAPK